jgi:signal transduction histidine kinase
VAHEINNPVNFIHGNLSHAHRYAEDLLEIVQAYQERIPNPDPDLNDLIEAVDLEFVAEDLPKLLQSMRVGTDRIREIVSSLRNFSRLDEADVKEVDLHEGIDSTLLILQNRLKPKPEHPGIEVVKQYGVLPRVECYAGQLNQVFMNILVNAIDALEERDRLRDTEAIKNHPSQITITTRAIGPHWVQVQLSDNGPGIAPDIQQRLFDPFFTTKPVGKGTGLGMSISYQIVTERHGGRLICESAPGQGATFVIEIPHHQTGPMASTSHPAT